MKLQHWAVEAHTEPWALPGQLACAEVHVAAASLLEVSELTRFQLPQVWLHKLQLFFPDWSADIPFDCKFFRAGTAFCSLYCAMHNRVFVHDWDS